MQTIKVKTNPLPWGCYFTINGKEIAMIGSDFCNPGKYSARFGAYASGRFGAYASGGNFATFADAVEFISDAITAHFAAFGLTVEFTA